MPSPKLDIRVQPALVAALKKAAKSRKKTVPQLVRDTLAQLVSNPEIASMPDKGGRPRKEKS